MIDKMSFFQHKKWLCCDIILGLKIFFQKKNSFYVKKLIDEDRGEGVGGWVRVDETDRSMTLKEV